MIIREQKIFIKDIIKAIENIFEFVGEMTLEEFRSDEKTLSAVIWKFEVIGEATKNLRENIIAKYKHIPWTEMARMRDRLIHGYQSINPEIIWKTIKDKLPGLPNELQKILNNF
jgi:uncharacterized protein with HEPN domain